MIGRAHCQHQVAFFDSCITLPILVSKSPIFSQTIGLFLSLARCFSRIETEPLCPFLAVVIKLSDLSDIFTFGPILEALLQDQMSDRNLKSLPYNIDHKIHSNRKCMFSVWLFLIRSYWKYCQPDRMSSMTLNNLMTTVLVDPKVCARPVWCHVDFEIVSWSEILRQFEVLSWPEKLRHLRYYPGRGYFGILGYHPGRGYFGILSYYPGRRYFGILFKTWVCDLLITM